MHHRDKFREDRSEWLTYSDFCDFQDGGRRHLGFLKTRNFNDVDCRGTICVIMTNFVHNWSIGSFIHSL